MSKVLIILTGGTICMVQNKATGALHPAGLRFAEDVIPELGSSEIEVESLSFDPLIDSSDVNPDNWVRMAQAVYDHYNGYDGFVICMARTRCPIRVRRCRLCCEIWASRWCLRVVNCRWA